MGERQVVSCFSMSRQPFPVPLRPDYSAVRGRPADTLYRAAAAHVLASHRKVSVDSVMRDEFPMITRAAAVPGTLGTTNWAGVLAGDAVADAVVGLAGPSASAELIRRGLRVSLAGLGSVTIPGRIITPDDAGSFVGEGSPIEVRELTLFSGPTLTPFKFAVIVAFTNEMLDYAVADFEAICRQMLTESASVALDSAIFSADAASSIRPAGILDGIAALTGEAGGGSNAVSKDIGALVGAIASGGTGRNIVFIAAPEQAATLKIWAGPQFDYPILASAALTAGTIIAIEAGSFVSAFDPVPNFNVATGPIIHMDTTPLAIGTAGSPPTVAAPSRSLWQTDCTGLRMILRCSWGLRATGQVAWISATTW
jgi:hypothetical protein